ncbi:MAG TPA: 50S ribosomal protein L24 [Nanoarchaeota archaeon]|nr:large subunit ribosomal protein L24 [uncultured archaeon]KHO48848.1 MAG: large subunit ribosomal protein L24 [archaeon GW2011_AR6]MBS3082792.1 50S ribosomal protein L24 [Candidatus Pacearchaeota archaeon]HIH17846.1 50S ribosomal protein L24 [Nanoarchaeota archaeon]HIH34102.1 50S ribosomal protein L24 [Nanoarchaeota archaeon]
MKRKFSASWVGSKKPSKQRKFRANAPLHLRHKFLSAHLAKDLKKKYLRRSFPLRKGDTVKVLRGAFKKRTAKVSSLNPRTLKVYLDGIQKQRRDGTKVNVPLEPSNLMITELALEDKERIKALERKLKR